MIEIETKDGSFYVIDPSLIACIARKKWKNLDSGDKLQTKDVCAIYWMGGGEVHISGANFDELVKLWRAQRTEVFMFGEQTPVDLDADVLLRAQDLQAKRPDKK